jgi:DNA replication protein DnaC
MANRQAELQQYLRALRLPTIAQQCSEIALKATREGLSHEAFLHEVLRLEVEARTQHRRERLLHLARLPREKTFATLQLDAFPAAVRLHLERLRAGDFLEQACNVIAVGPPGTGKSHAFSAVGHDLVQRGHTVLWTTTADMVHQLHQLLAAKRDLRLPALLSKLDRVEALILDDSGYVQQAREEMEVFFTLLAARYERRSVLISSNLVLSQWQTIFTDPLTTLAAVDRVVHHAVLLDRSGIASYRANQAQHQVAPGLSEYNAAACCWRVLSDPLRWVLPDPGLHLRRRNNDRLHGGTAFRRFPWTGTREEGSPHAIIRYLASLIFSCKTRKGGVRL